MSENENSPPLSSPQDPNDELVVCLPADAVRQLTGPGFTPTMATSTTPANKRVLEELDSMPVTSILGIVFSVELDDAEAAALVAYEEEVSQFQFEDLEKVRADAASFEKWSTAILQSP